MPKMPIYRAKKHKDKGYVFGWYFHSHNKPYESFLMHSTGHYLEGGWNSTLSYTEFTKIKPDTLAVHFDKEDEDGKPVFFALGKKGGDIVEYYGEKYIAVFDKKQERARFVGMNDSNTFSTLSLEAVVKIVGKS